MNASLQIQFMASCRFWAAPHLINCSIISASSFVGFPIYTTPYRFLLPFNLRIIPQTKNPRESANGGQVVGLDMLVVFFYSFYKSLK
jgi:hypothetical protein